MRLVLTLISSCCTEVEIAISGDVGSGISAVARMVRSRTIDRDIAIALPQER
jgi:hypothetical protein